jgi:hypothetical protein
MSERKSQTEEGGQVDKQTGTDIHWEDLPTEGTCDLCSADAEYQVWDEAAIEEPGRTQILGVCRRHRQQGKSKLKQIRTEDD